MVQTIRLLIVLFYSLDSDQAKPKYVHVRVPIYIITFYNISLFFSAFTIINQKLRNENCAIPINEIWLKNQSFFSVISKSL